MISLPASFLPPATNIDPLGDAPLGFLARADEPGFEESFLLKAVSLSAITAVGAPPGVVDAEVRKLTRLGAGDAPSLLRFATDGDYLFLLSEWPRGKKIEDLVKGRGLELARLTEWCQQLFDQLADLHSSGVLHRSICRESMRIRDGRAYMFGPSVAAVAEQPLEVRAPEVGSKSLFDEAHSEQSDIYSLAQVLLDFSSELEALPAELAPLLEVLRSCVVRESSSRPSDAGVVGLRLRDAAQQSEAANRQTRPLDPRVFAALPGSTSDGSSQGQPLEDSSTSLAGELPANALAESVGPIGEPGVLATPLAQQSKPAEPHLQQVERMGSVAVDPEASHAERRGSGFGRMILAAAVVVVALGAVWLASSSVLDSADGRQGRSPDLALDPAGQDQVRRDALSTGEREVASSNPDLESPPNSAPKDEALLLAKNLLGGSSKDLFGPADPDPVLQAELRADLESLDFEDDPRANEIADSLFGVNPLTSSDNPLLASALRERWLAEAIRNVGDREALEHLSSESEKLRDQEVSLAEWYEHVVACKEVCNLVVLGLLQEHIRRVQELPHSLLLFERSQDALPAVEAGKLTRLVQDAPAGAQLLLIGRASRSGNREFNRELSKRRVESAVRAALAEGVQRDQIETLWLGYEPPQITESLAQRYGLDLEVTEADQLNQSVIAVVHSEG